MGPTDDNPYHLAHVWDSFQHEIGPEKVRKSSKQPPDIEFANTDSILFSAPLSLVSTLWKTLNPRPHERIRSEMSFY